MRIKFQRKVQDTKGIKIWSCRSKKDKQHNCQKKKDKRIYKTLHIKLKIEQREPYNNNIKHLKSVDRSRPEIIFCFTFIFFDYLALLLMSVYLLWWSGCLTFIFFDYLSLLLMSVYLLWWSGCLTFIFFDYLALQLMSVYLLWWSGCLTFIFFDYLSLLLMSVYLTLMKWLFDFYILWLFVLVKQPLHQS
jgi:hypothetical protein